MKLYLKNKFKDRLAYCKEWQHSVDIYLANKEITKKADREYYKSKPLLKIILNLYFIPYNTLRFFRYLQLTKLFKSLGDVKILLFKIFIIF